MKLSFFSFFRSTSFDASYNIFSKEKNDSRPLGPDEFHSMIEWLSEDHSSAGWNKFNQFNELEETLEDNLKK